MAKKELAQIPKSDSKRAPAPPKLVCKICAKEIPINISPVNPFVTQAGAICGGCGSLMCNDCRSLPHSCKEQLAKLYSSMPWQRDANGKWNERRVK